jgi:hypothetical protein
MSNAALSSAWGKPWMILPEQLTKVRRWTRFKPTVAALNFAIESHYNLHPNDDVEKNVWQCGCYY